MLDKLSQSTAKNELQKMIELGLPTIFIVQKIWKKRKELQLKFY